MPGEPRAWQRTAQIYLSCAAFFISYSALSAECGVELAVFLVADRVEQLQLGLEEVDVAFLVPQQFLEQVLGHVVAQLFTDFADSL